MLLECSGWCARSTSTRLPRPAGAHSPAIDESAPLRWLTAFPSYGFVLSVRRRCRARCWRVSRRDIACAVVGEVCVAAGDVGQRGGDTRPCCGTSHRAVHHRRRAGAEPPRLKPLKFIALLTHSVNPRGGVVHVLELAAR